MLSPRTRLRPRRGLDRSKCESERRVLIPVAVGRSTKFRGRPEWWRPPDRRRRCASKRCHPRLRYRALRSPDFSRGTGHRRVHRMSDENQGSGSRLSPPQDVANAIRASEIVRTSPAGRSANPFDRHAQRIAGRIGGRHVHEYHRSPVTVLDVRRMGNCDYRRVHQARQFGGDFRMLRLHMIDSILVKSHFVQRGDHIRPNCYVRTHLSFSKPLDAFIVENSCIHDPLTGMRSTMKPESRCARGRRRSARYLVAASITFVPDSRHVSKMPLVRPVLALQ